jgi:integrase
METPPTVSTSTSERRLNPPPQPTATTPADGQRCTFHDLRHSHAALLIAQGEHPKVVQERLGHASIETTLDTYGHLFEGLDEAAADRLEATFAADDVHAMCTREESAMTALGA